MDYGRLIALAYKEMWQEWNNFYGRTDVTEYWGSFMLNMLLVGAGTTFDYLAEIFLVVSLVPMVAMTVRRLNDSGTHWAWLFACLVPVLGWILFFYLTFKKSLPWEYDEDDLDLTDWTETTENKE